MKALTIIQPFAELIARGGKRVENRTWPTSYRGRIAIHAGKAKRYGGESVSEIASEYCIDPSSLAFGAIIATANLVECVRVRQGFLDGSRKRSIEHLGPRFAWMLDHEHAEGPWCWILEDAVREAVPVPCNGSLGLWDFTR